ncbi:MAG TPA: AsmA-like C-terminal region-containing protein [Bryobacteraceae bacterium]|nr:AsmA-like C-terminal region-containing protein [Bryobacteraceae bacterium]
MRKRSRIWKWLAIVGLIAGLIGVGVATANYWLSPILSERLSAVARARFGSELHFQQLTVSLFPHVAVNARGVVFRQHARTDVPPLFAIDRVSVEAGFRGLIGPYRRARRMVFEGLRITIPPKDPNTPHASLPKPHTGDRFIADEMIADNTLLTILPSKPGKEPLVFDIYKLSLRPGGQAAMHYKAQLRNARPPGLIDAEGDFGPWYNEDPGHTKLNGRYTFSHADLAVFKGISGFLSSTGQFDGILATIHASGTTDTPDFALRSGGHPVHLTTQFDAVINGTDGETLLQPVTARFRRTAIVCRGGIVQEHGDKQKTVDLQGTVSDGRLEDILWLATKSKLPMTGALSFDSKIVIPPGDVDVEKKLQLAGRATVHDMRFTSANIQTKLNELSDRARGEPAAAHDQNVASDLKARFTMNNGVIDFPGLSFTVPGASITLSGHYSMLDESLDFAGHARTQATLSQMTTGLKHILLKAADPFFEKDGAGAVLPVHITGTREHPSFGL